MSIYLAINDIFLSVLYLSYLVKAVTKDLVCDHTATGRTDLGFEFACEGREVDGYW